MLSSTFWCYFAMRLLLPNNVIVRIAIRSAIVIDTYGADSSGGFKGQIPLSHSSP